MHADFHCTAIVEIRREADGRIPADLICAAYRASSRTPVMLVLDSVTRGEVDRILDPLVTANRHGFFGVQYASLHEQPAMILASAAQASVVFAQSDAFRRELATVGVLVSVATTSITQQVEQLEGLH